MGYVKSQAWLKGLDWRHKFESYQHIDGIKPTKLVEERRNSEGRRGKGKVWVDEDRAGQREEPRSLTSSGITAEIQWCLFILKSPQNNYSDFLMQPIYFQNNGTEYNSIF